MDGIFSILFHFLLGTVELLSNSISGASNEKFEAD